MLLLLLLHSGAASSSVFVTVLTRSLYALKCRERYHIQKHNNNNLHTSVCVCLCQNKHILRFFLIPNEKKKLFHFHIFFSLDCVRRCWVKVFHFACSCVYDLYSLSLHSSGSVLVAVALLYFILILFIKYFVCIELKWLYFCFNLLLPLVLTHMWDWLCFAWACVHLFNRSSVTIAYLRGCNSSSDSDSGSGSDGGLFATAVMPFIILKCVYHFSTTVRIQTHTLACIPVYSIFFPFPLRSFVLFTFAHSFSHDNHSAIIVRLYIHIRMFFPFSLHVLNIALSLFNCYK